MSQKIATKSYELYRQENPGSKMTKAEYDAKYHAGQHGTPKAPEAPGTPSPPSGVKAPPPVEKAKPMPAVKPPKQQHSPLQNAENTVPHDAIPTPDTIPVNTKRVNADKGFAALFDYANQGKLHSAKDASTLIRHLGYNEQEFADYLFKNLGGKTNVNQIKQFEDLGVLPHSYVKRRLNWGMHQQHVPPKLYQHYGIQGDVPGEPEQPEAPPTKAARISKIFDDISSLEKIAAEDYKEYKQEHPHSKKSPNDPMFHPAMGQTKPHLSHEEMQKLPESEHERLAAEHSAHAQGATKASHEARKNNDLDKVRQSRDLSNKHDDASYMHRAYAYANTRKQQIPQEMRAKHLQNAERTHKDLSGS